MGRASGKQHKEQPSLSPPRWLQGAEQPKGIGSCPFQNFSAGDIWVIQDVLSRLEPLAEKELERLLELDEQDQQDKIFISLLQEIIKQSAICKEGFQNLENSQQGTALSLSQSALLQKQYADSITLLVDLYQFVSSRPLEGVKEILKPAIDLTEPQATEMMKIFKRYNDTPTDAGHIVNFYRAHNAIRLLVQSQTVNSAAVWSYLSQKFGSDNPEDWLRELAARGGSYLHRPGSACQEVEAIIYGAKAAERDTKYRRILKRCLEEEEEWRLKANLLGKLPDVEVIFLSSGEWLHEHETESLGMHRIDLNNPDDEACFVFLEPAIQSTKVEIEQTVVHELIHSLRHLPSEKPLKFFRDFSDQDNRFLEKLMQEAITQGLAYGRISVDWERTSQVDPEMPYGKVVNGFLYLMNQAKIKPEDRLAFFEYMNTLSPAEQLQTIKKMLTGNITDHLRKWISLSQ